MEGLPFKDRSKILNEHYSFEHHTYECRFSKSVKYLDSSLLDFLPAGIIDKGKTGFGATTFELNSKRNSIIVEPLKVTASSKAGKNHLYIGSETPKHPSKISDEDIIDYLKDESIEFKKIICVSDSLKRVQKLLKKEFFHDFFLMIDESDSMQMESKYRSSMEEVFSIYKRHPKEKRCLISATPIHFHDPDLSEELRIYFSFEEEEKRTIQIIESSNHKGTAADLILSLYNQSPDEKIVLALNNVTTLKEIAYHLIKKGVNKEEISILCGSNSSEKVKGFYKWFYRVENNCCKIFKSTKIGGGVVCFHPFASVLNAQSIGENFVFRNGLTIGNKSDDNSKLPIIGNNVEVGANVVIIGNISIGDNVTIGAGSVVVKDVEPNVVIAGNPAKVIRIKNV